MIHESVSVGERLAALGNEQKQNFYKNLMELSGRKYREDSGNIVLTCDKPLVTTGRWIFKKETPMSLEEFRPFFARIIGQDLISVGGSVAFTEKDNSFTVVIKNDLAKKFLEGKSLAEAEEVNKLHGEAIEEEIERSHSEANKINASGKWEELVAAKAAAAAAAEKGPKK